MLCGRGRVVRDETSQLSTRLSAVLFSIGSHAIRNGRCCGRGDRSAGTLAVACVLGHGGASPDR